MNARVLLTLTPLEYPIKTQQRYGMNTRSYTKEEKQTQQERLKTRPRMAQLVQDNHIPIVAIIMTK